MFLYKKIKKGVTYYYLRQTKRVKGKVVCEFQIYIGNKKRLYQVIQNGLNPIAKIAKPKSSRVYNFGSVAAMLSIANEMNLFNIIDAVCHKREQDLPISVYLVVAAINRSIHAKSKKALGEWLSKTSLPHILPRINLEKMSSQHFWNHMNMINESDIANMENEIVKQVVKTQKINLDAVLYDSTNFYSYIHSFNEDNKIEARGHNKQKRDDLRQANFALLVSKDHHIPLYHKVYDGNENDFTAFTKTIFSLKEKRDILTQTKKEGSS
jgi:transposase